MNEASATSRRQIVARLAEEVGRQRPIPAREASPIRLAREVLTPLLPSGGFRPGTLVEILAASSGAGATTLAVAVAREACAPGGWLAVVESGGAFFAPSLAVWGLALERVLLVAPDTPREMHWAIDQVLHCPGLAAALIWPGRRRLDARTFRRWQLAAEQSGILGLFVRSADARREPTWADVRLLVEPLPSSDDRRRLRIELLHGRQGALAYGSAESRSLEVLVNHETHALESVARSPRRMPLAPQLADPALASRAVG